MSLLCELKVTNGGASSCRSFSVQTRLLIKKS